MSGVSLRTLSRLFCEFLGADRDDGMACPAVCARCDAWERDVVEGQPVATPVKAGQARRGILQHVVDLEAACVTSAVATFRLLVWNIS